ncbi:hypothetical protein SSS_02173 [Sarcoptes scabiei]|uniref:EB domain-containing protein n=1 Tax=Sarcoptes scabiei TaxID=52283 RepID=A0A834VDZ2_SARSC|nr:hypothetical protein SSS_02173 [Sarcoptes scabiei]
MMLKLINRSFRSAILQMIVMILMMKSFSSSSSSSSSNFEIDQCRCNVKFFGEYCGDLLNQRDVLNRCKPNRLYFCGRSNLENAIELNWCNDNNNNDNNNNNNSREEINADNNKQNGYNYIIVEKDCNRKEFDASICMKRMDCRCPNTLRRKGKYCGSKLIGQQCQNDLIYRCPFIRDHLPTIVDACPFGCSNGNCLKQDQGSK